MRLAGQQATQVDALASSLTGTTRASPVIRLHGWTHSPIATPVNRLYGRTHSPIASPDCPGPLIRLQALRFTPCNTTDYPGTRTPVAGHLPPDIGPPSHGPSTTPQKRPISGLHATPAMSSTQTATPKCSNIHVATPAQAPHMALFQSHRSLQAHHLSPLHRRGVMWGHPHAMYCICRNGPLPTLVHPTTNSAN
jgi:hypothetical protein